MEYTIYELNKEFKKIWKKLDELSCSYNDITGKNIGLGYPLFTTRYKNYLQFRTIIAGDNITISQQNETLTISGISTETNPGGSDSSIQFNDGGLFGGVSNFVFKKDTTRTGIGISDPQSVLHIGSPAEQDIGGTLIIENTAEPFIENQVAIDLYTIPYDFNAGIPNARILAFDDGNYSADLRFITKDPGAPINSLINRMEILSDGTIKMNYLSGGGDQMVAVDNNGVLYAAALPIVPTLTDQQIAFGSPSNEITSSPDLVFDGNVIQVTSNGSSSSWGQVQSVIASSSSEAGLSFYNLGTGGRIYNIISTSDASGIGGGNLSIGDATSSEEIFRYQNSDNSYIFPFLGGSGSVVVFSDNSGKLFTGTIPANYITSVDNTATINLNVSGGELTADFASMNISQFTNDSSYLDETSADALYYSITNPSNYINRTGISGGTGINYDNSTGIITNSAPDQTVILNSGTGISISGTYPNFTITNSSPSSGGTVTNFIFTDGNGFTGTVSTSTTTPTLSLSLQNATTSQSGQLTSTDWNTFNGKQSALSGSGIVKSVSGVISYISGTSSQFVKGDGSLDSSTYVTSLSVTTNQGVSGSFTAGATPALTLNLGALTGVTSYNGLVITPNTGTITTGRWLGTKIETSVGGTSIDTSASTGIPQISAGTWSVSTALPNGTTATTQSAADNSTKLATTAYVDTTSTSVLRPANNLSDVSNPITAVTNLGLITVTISGDVTTTSNVASNVTGLSYSVAANATYLVKVYMHIGCNNTGGVSVGVNGPSGTTLWLGSFGRAGSATAFTYGSVTALNTLTTVNYGTLNNANSFVCMEGHFITSSTSGTLQVIFASGTNTQTSTVYKNGTTMQIQRIA